MQLRKNILPRLMRLCKSFYFIVTVLFVVFVLFLDSNDLFTQIMLERQYHTLKQERHRYQQKIEEIRQQKKELNKDSTIERIARERYLLKRPLEDVYVIEKKPKD